MANSITIENFSTLKVESPLIQEAINKIMNTLSFRKLAGKTQVILSLSGPNVRTRLTHTIEVAKIARDLCNRLNLNADLGEAIALAHDIGHTPFGHVGERTLREIMCGCDTLKGQIATDDGFSNSGFKHNLQSFRVLNNIERLAENSEGEKFEKIWPYIFWGAAAHSSMSWMKPQSGIDNDIYITCKHCSWVFVCNYHEKKECKKNIQKKKDLKPTKEEICKPWFCADLSIVKTPEEAEKYGLKPRDSIAEIIAEKFIKRDEQLNIYCCQKCYMAKLWEYKKDNNDSYLEYTFLYDHPFPNIFYTKEFFKFFNSKGENSFDFISIEAVVVELADEIAQRQQDLEDGIQKNLVSMKDARSAVKGLVKKFYRNSKDKEIDDIANQEELGSFIVKFYEDVLVKATKSNIKKFSNNDQENNINIYCLVNCIYELDEHKTYMSGWLNSELKNLISKKKLKVGAELLKPYFSIDKDEKYFCFIVFNYLDDLLKTKMEKSSTILLKFIDYLKKAYPEECNGVSIDIDDCKDTVAYVKCMNSINAILDKKPFEDVYLDMHSKPAKRKYWKTITDFNLYQFYFLEKFIIKNSSILKADSVNVAAIINDNNIPKTSIDIYYKNFDEVYRNWKQALGNKANQVLSNLVCFVSDKDPNKKGKEDSLDAFEKNLKNTILHSEKVEKNDGKASYILKRLFKAFIANSHQLPDECLRMIVCNLVDSYSDYIEDEEDCFNAIVKKLKKTTPNYNEGKGTKTKPPPNPPKKDIIEILLNLNFFLIAKENKKEGKKYKDIEFRFSNEITALCGKRIELYEFLNDIDNLKDSSFLKKAMINDNEELPIILRKLRGVLDNPILNATPFWKSLLTRGICDYIASLTDQEAIDEYEKLYAGIMELV